MMMGQKRERDDDEEENSITSVLPPQGEQAIPTTITNDAPHSSTAAPLPLPVSTPEGVAPVVAATTPATLSSTTTAGNNNDEIDEDIVTKANTALSAVFSAASAAARSASFYDYNKKNIRPLGFEAGGVAEWRRRRGMQHHGSDVGGGMVEPPATDHHHPTTSAHLHPTISLSSLCREDFPGMEWDNEIASNNDEDVEEQTKGPCPPTSSADIHNPIVAGSQKQPLIKIAISEEMRSLYHILLGAVASLVNTTTPSTATSSAPCTPTSVPMRHLLDIFQQPESQNPDAADCSPQCGDGQHPNIQLLRTLISTLCTSTTTTTNNKEEGGEAGTEMKMADSHYIVLSPLLSTTSPSASKFTLRHQSGQYRKYNDNLEVQIRKRIVFQHLFYTSTASTATMYLDNIPTLDTDRSGVHYAFNIGGIYVSSSYSALIASAVGVVVDSSDTPAAVDKSDNTNGGGESARRISWSDECQVIMMGWRGGHVVLTEEDRRHLAVAYRLKTAGYKQSIDPSILPGQMYTLQQEVTVHANVVTQ